MATLKKLFLKEIKLKNSGGIVKVGLTYGDQLEIQQVLMKDLSMTMVDGKSSSTTSISGELLLEETRAMMTRGIKEWDFTEEDGTPLPITWDNIQLLDKEDAEMISTELLKINNPKRSEQSEEEFKKK